MECSADKSPLIGHLAGPIRRLEHSVRRSAGQTTSPARGFMQQRLEEPRTPRPRWAGRDSVGVITIKPLSKNPEAIRVYHFLSAEYALEDLRCRRLKISRITELNDPFEFLGVDLSDHKLRWAINDTKRQLSKTNGLLCFSETWGNPVLWGHYADGHRGICLGFDVPRTFLRKVEYVTCRQPLPKTLDEAFMRRLLSTKFSHWQYEQEYRAFVGLDTETDGHYFMDFSDKLKLRCVIVGDQSDVTQANVASALEGIETRIEVFKARAAFRLFEVVRNKEQSMWA